ncbi:hypothetical protein KP509_07G028700 [Ceratopteris richardii]|nr:hypothetical protein KP509_07G028700 [Ceratopteris richardii]
MYAKCGEVVKSEELLRLYKSRDIFSWTDLISAYVRSGHNHDAFNCFERMYREGISPDAVTFSCILKACGNMKAIRKGLQVHEEIARLGLLENNVVLGNALVDMYAKCGALIKAHQVVDELPVRDVITWSTLINAYAQGGHGEHALDCFQQMQQNGISPDAVTFACALKACSSTRATDIGEQLHIEISRRGLLNKDSLLGDTLVDMYAKCGSFKRAKGLLRELPCPSVVSWSALIAGYVEHNQGEHALECYYEMQYEGFLPNAVTYLSILKACASIGALEVGKVIHDEIDFQGLLKDDDILGAAIVDMYAKCGALEAARQVLNDLPVQSVVSWNALMTGYCQKGLAEQVLTCFEWIEEKGIPPTQVTYLCVLKAYGIIGAADNAEHIHCEIARQGFLESDDGFIANALVDMYAKCGSLARAQQLLEVLPDLDVSSWNSLIAGYVHEGFAEQALHCFQQMSYEGQIPDEITYLLLLKACGSICALEKGELLHKEIFEQGLVLNNTFLGTALVDMYAKCGAFRKAEMILEELPAKNEGSWTALISGYAEQNQAEHALHCFERMKSRGFSADEITFLSVLKACGSIGALDQGEKIHMEIARQGILWTDVILGSALLNMYAKCGALAKAERVFEELPARNIVSWCALITGYAHHSQDEQALKCFERMQDDGLSADAVTFLCILKACTNLGAAERGEQLHDEIAKQGLLGKDAVLGNALVDMYAKSGDFAKAQQVLDELSDQNFVCWNTLIAGYAQHGQAEQALKCFEQMQQKGISPDAVTLLSILKACSSVGLVDAAYLFFVTMKKRYGVQPDLKHYTSIVDAFGRAGKLSKAIQLIQETNNKDLSVPLWCAVLSACEKWGDLNAGKWAFQHAIQADKGDPAAYILMANMYAAVGLQEHAESIDAPRIENTTSLGTGLLA